MIKDSNRTIQKLEAAQRQLQTAIQLWFADGEPISIHTLTCAAHQIIHDICVHRGQCAFLFDSIFVKDNRRAEWNHAVKEHMNFFKHADKDPNGTIEFNPSLTEPFILFSVLSLESIGEPLTPEEFAFALWSCLHNSDWLNEAGRDAFQNRIPVEQLAQLRHVPKKRFYSLYSMYKLGIDNVKIGQ